MLSTRNVLHFSGALTVVALAVGSAAAFPIPRPTAHHNNGKKHNTKATDSLDTAIKDLEAAEKDLESKNWSGASQQTRNADQIVAGADSAAKQTRDRMIENGAPKDQRDQIKARIAALNGVLKDIHTAEREIAARKTDDAVTAIKSAIAGLEGLTGHGEKKK